MDSPNNDFRNTSIDRLSFRSFAPDYPGTVTLLSPPPPSSQVFLLVFVFQVTGVIFIVVLEGLWKRYSAFPFTGKFSNWFDRESRPVREGLTRQGKTVLNYLKTLGRSHSLVLGRRDRPVQTRSEEGGRLRPDSTHGPKVQNTIMSVRCMAENDHDGNPKIFRHENGRDRRGEWCPTPLTPWIPYTGESWCNGVTREDLVWDLLNLVES